MSQRAVVFGLGLLFVIAGAFAQSDRRPINWEDLPEPFHSESVKNRSEVISRPEGAKLNLPEDFAVEEYMSGFERARFMMLGPTKRAVWGRPVGLLQLPDGSLLVSDDGGQKLWRIAYQR